MSMRRDKDAGNDFLPFFLIVIAAMIFIYSMTLYTNPGLRQFPELVIFTAGMLIHLVLHWMFRRIAEAPMYAILYFIVQSLIAGALILYTGETILIFGLYLALMGEEVGLFGSLKAIVLIVAINLVLMSVTLLLKDGFGGFNLLMLAGIVPMIIFVIVYVYLYNRQYEARLEAQNLLAELKAANTELSASREKIERLSRGRERQRIARELHDTLAQGLSGLILQLEAVSANLEQGKTAEAGDIVDSAMRKARETLSGARGVIDDIRRSREGGTSFREFCEGLLGEAGRSAGFEFSIGIDEDIEMSSGTREQVEKILSEAVGNCARHSGARHVELDIVRSGGEVSLSLSDDGAGFVPGEAAPGHYGLLGMKERAQAIGGRIFIDSSPGEGTEVRLIFPGESCE